MCNNVPNVQHFFGEFRCCTLGATGVLSTAPFIGGFFACLLDNIIKVLLKKFALKEHLVINLFKGTDEERGILTWYEIRNHANSVYEVPLLKYFVKICPKFSLLPIFPPKPQ